MKGMCTSKHTSNLYKGGGRLETSDTVVGGTAQLKLSKGPAACLWFSRRKKMDSWGDSINFTWGQRWCAKKNLVNKGVRKSQTRGRRKGRKMLGGNWNRKRNKTRGKSRIIFDKGSVGDSYVNEELDKPSTALETGYGDLVAVLRDRGIGKGGWDGHKGV